MSHAPSRPVLIFRNPTGPPPRGPHDDLVARVQRLLVACPEFADVIEAVCWGQEAGVRDASEWEH